MNLIEILLRLGCSMVAWMIVYTHCIWTATLRVVGCQSSGDELWRLLLGFAPITLGFCMLLNASHKMPGVNRILAYLGIPLIGLIPLALVAIWPSIGSATIDGQAICSTGSAALWHRLWAPVQLLTFGAIAFAVVHQWRARNALPA